MALARDDLLCALSDDLPVPCAEVWQSRDELVELSFRLQLDLQLGDVQVLGVAQLAQEDVYISSAIRSVTLRVSALLGDLEEDDLGRGSWR